MSGHCPFCADPWRGVLLGLLRAGRGPTEIATHYRLRASTLRSMLSRARRAGCIPPKTCRYCPTPLPSETQAERCAKAECKRAMWRDQARRKRQGPEVLEWPLLPPRPRRYVNAVVSAVEWSKPRGVVAPPLTPTLGSVYLRAA